MNKNRIALYVRTSTKNQNADYQLEMLQNYCKARDFTDITVYKDYGRSGRTPNRDGLSQLLKDARSRNIDIVICTALDRFFRSLKDLIITLQELDELGIKFIALREQIDLTTSVGKLVLHMVGAMAQFEADLNKERVSIGLDVAKSKGKKLGRPKADYSNIIVMINDGMDNKTIANKLDISLDTVERAKLSLISSRSVRDIADEFGVSKSTISAVKKNI